VEGPEVPAIDPEPHERRPLSPHEEAALADIGRRLQASDPAFVARLSSTGDDGGSRISLRAVGASITLLMLVLIVTRTPPAVWPLLGLLIALHLLPVVLLWVFERGDRP
jgi:hypothetical protein